MPITMPPLPVPFAERGWWLINALKDKFDLTLNQAAAIVGNLGFESGGLKIMQEIAPVGGGRGGYGWAQWTGPRRLAYEAWCRNQGLAASSDEANYRYLCVELQSSHKYVMAALRKETELGRCVFVFGRLYEAPGGTTETHLPGYDGRLNYAQQGLAGGKPPIIIGAPKADAPAALPGSDDPEQEQPDDYDYTAIIRTAEALQLQLRDAGLYDGEIDGAFGPNSSAAAMQAWRMAKG